LDARGVDPFEMSLKSLTNAKATSELEKKFQGTKRSVFVGMFMLVFVIAFDMVWVDARKSWAIAYEGILIRNKATQAYFKQYEPRCDPLMDRITFSDKTSISCSEVRRWRDVDVEILSLQQFGGFPTWFLDFTGSFLVYFMIGLVAFLVYEVWMMAKYHRQITDLTKKQVKFSSSLFSKVSMARASNPPEAPKLDNLKTVLNDISDFRRECDSLVSKSS
jgi:hypothetical protein